MTDITNPPLRTVRLYGKLGATFGRVHRFALDSNSAAEAVRALSSQLAGFRAYLMKAKDRGMAFAVFAGKKNLTREELSYPAGAEDIRIAPVILGSKRGGVLNFVLGAALIVAGAFTMGTSSALGIALISSGASMALGGVTQMLAPHPHLESPQEDSANTPSYAFNGPVNTEAQGHPVPVLYGGPLWVGGAVISAGVDAKEHAAAYQPPPSNAGHMGYGGDLYR